jgi:hypothetical protein
MNEEPGQGSENGVLASGNIPRGCEGYSVLYVHSPHRLLKAEEKISRLKNRSVFVARMVGRTGVLGENGTIATSGNLSSSGKGARKRKKSK